MQVVIKDIVFNVFIEKKNIKNMYLRVREDGIHISANIFVPKSMIERFIFSNSDEIYKAYESIKKKKEKREEFYYLGKKYDVIITNAVSKIEFYDNRVYVKDKKYLNTFLRNMAKDVFNERLKICYSKFSENIPYPSLMIGKMTRKWGYCNKSKCLVKLNYNLIYYSVNEIDYVIIHELSHLIEFNHSKNFWKIVKKYKPDYLECQRVLKEE